MLAVVDDFTRECIALVADTSLSGSRVGRELDAVITRRGRPLVIVSDNGMECSGMVTVSTVPPAAAGRGLPTDARRLAW
jgi:transposase InsO family protein